MVISQRVLHLYFVSIMLEYIFVIMADSSISFFLSLSDIVYRTAEREISKIAMCHSMPKERNCADRKENINSQSCHCTLSGDWGKLRKVKKMVQNCMLIHVCGIHEMYNSKTIKSV